MEQILPDGNLVLVTTECSNVLMKPVERQTLIAQTNVRIARASHFLASQKSPTAETVGELNAVVSLK